MNFEDVAKQLIRIDESIILIYAFNGTGKTQLSVAYKNVTKDDKTGKHAGVYYNAFSEDLLFGITMKKMMVLMCTLIYCRVA